MDIVGALLLFCTAFHWICAAVFGGSDRMDKAMYHAVFTLIFVVIVAARQFA